jgi:hypothetical protein
VSDLTPRQALARAIERRSRLEGEASTLAAAIPAARRAQNDAMHALAAAKEAVEKATESATTHAIAVLAGDVATEAPIDAEAARVELRRAQDRLDASNATRSEIDRRQRAVQDRLAGAHYPIDDAVRQVIFSETRDARDTLVQRVRAAQIEFNDATASLWVLLRGRPSPERKEDQAHVAAASSGTQIPEDAVLPTTAKLRGWEQALHTDPAAEMPE